MSDTSVFQTFPQPPGSGEVTVCEQYGDISHITQTALRPKVSGYPEVTITKELTRSLTHRENAKSAFLPHDETVSKRAYHAWNEMGLSGALEEIVNSTAEVPTAVSAMAQKLLVLTRWTSSLHGSFFPHLALSNEDMVTKFSIIPDWSSSPVKAFAWHPHTTKFAYALHDDTVKIHTQGSELVPTLKHKLQKNVASLAWQPHSASVLAVACQSCVLIWHIEPTSLATRPSSSSVQVLQESSHCPVTSVSWSPDGKILMSASPVDSTMMAWDVPMETCVPLRRFGGGGVSLLSWSPDGSKVFTATPSNLFRVWETKHWICEKWTTASGRCKAACWSLTGGTVLFATENQPIIYSLTFADNSDGTSSVIGGSSTAVASVDLSEISLKTSQGSSVKVGGFVQSMDWDPTSERLAVTFTDNKDYVAVFRTKLYPTLEVTPCGFVKGEDGEIPQHISFHPKFNNGALLTVVWSSGRIGYVPLHFIPSDTSEYCMFNNQPAFIKQPVIDALYTNA